jgi:hypothetical protein
MPLRRSGRTALFPSSTPGGALFAVLVDCSYFFAAVAVVASLILFDAARELVLG